MYKQNKNLIIHIYALNIWSEWLGYLFVVFLLFIHYLKPQVRDLLRLPCLGYIVVILCIIGRVCIFAALSCQQNEGDSTN